MFAWFTPLIRRPFTIAAAVGFIGDVVFHDAGNFWTGWIVQIAEWLPTFVIVTAIAGLVTGPIDFVVGIALIVVGSAASGILAKVSPAVAEQSG